MKYIWSKSLKSGFFSSRCGLRNLHCGWTKTQFNFVYKKFGIGVKNTTVWRYFLWWNSKLTALIRCYIFCALYQNLMILIQFLIWLNYEKVFFFRYLFGFPPVFDIFDGETTVNRLQQWHWFCNEIMKVSTLKIPPEWKTWVKQFIDKITYSVRKVYCTRWTYTQF